MPITNRLSLPAPIIKALERDTYTAGDGDFTCTELISPPKIAALRFRHKEEIFEDAADLLYSLLGSALHGVLEQSGMKTEGYNVETRHYAQYGRWKVSAKYDAFFVDGKKLSDYKQTTTYAFQRDKDGKMEIKKEWYAQLNIQADILRRDIGADIQELEIVGFLRDWQPTKALKDELYPQNQIIIMSIPIAKPENIEKYVLERCALHQAARDQANDDLIPECNKEERWEEADKFAVMKKGLKRAVRLFDSELEAIGFMMGVGTEAEAGTYSMETRPGFARRCLGIGKKVYCPARNFCHHYKEISKSSPL